MSKRTLKTERDAGLSGQGRAGFAMANSVRNWHSCAVNITDDARKYAAEQGIAAEEALKRGMEAKSKEFVVRGAEVYAQV